ncbi:MAG TPA: hypothetical protein VML95_10880 [Longimicrobiales bacterium]|nr:hypothetical protein [Longimicrobiales bacterium]
MKRPGALALLASLVVLPTLSPPLYGQAPVDRAEARSFVEAARRAAVRFADRSTAVRSGYRRVGPDFPGMGEHWVHPGRIISGTIDATQPPILSYATRDGRPTLVGVAFAVPLGPGEPPPSAPFDPEVWHDHTSAVQEELLFPNHPASMHGDAGGYRLGVVHVWTGVENAAGILTQNNWALPFWREGLEAPSPVSQAAARAVSLGRDGGFYRQLLHRAADLSPEEGVAVDAALARSGTAARRAIEGYRSNPSVPIDQRSLEAIWEALWREIRDTVDREKWVAISRVAGLS